MGTKVTIEANHKSWMKGAKAGIDSAEKTAVYMANYIPTTDREKVKNY